MIETKVITPDLLDDLGNLFCTNRHTEKCWCMWHIISVKAFHAGGEAENRAQLTQLAHTEDKPIGILAYQENEPVGWCAVGPRERYARAIKAPTYRHKGDEPFTNVWLVPCFFVRSDVRKMGVTILLLKTAVQLAKEYNAEAIDGFPFASGKRRSSSQIHVGFESTFLACGFDPIRRPSESRVVMRRVL
ncbi:MAG: GNAT family N-acetyltransferase [Chloroflexota bacterium]